ncbi:MAG TPA: adenylate/guanylate cyclase domain-containing protein [Caulobacteraceae bacterium]
MRCSQCHWETTGSAKFCAECGAAMAQPCPSCGEANAPGAKFCVNCGSQLAAAARAPQIEIAAPVVSASAPERRLVTVAFFDLADSTRLSTELDPEDYREVISAYHVATAAIVERLGGFVAKYMGDGVLAYFGYPAAREDDAERAVRAGLALVAKVETLETRANGLQARVGLATGSVIVGDLIGEGSSREQAIAGETPNLAARLQALAEGGGVVISASTHELTSRLFDYQDLGAVELKGFARPQSAFRVLAANDRLGRFEALRSTRTPLVGREEELEILLRRWERTRQGEPQIVLIRAEAGVGKSRLLAAFREAIKGQDQQQLTAFCAPHASDSAFYPTIRSLEARCGFVSSDTTAGKLGKLEALIRQAHGQLPGSTAALLASLLSLPFESRYPPLDLTPQQIKDETIRALVQLSLRAASVSPVVHMVEDAHWIDPSSLELLRAQVRDMGADVPIMLVATYRPEFQPPAEWLGQPNVASLTLSRLRAVDAKAMIARVAAGKRLPEAVVLQILDHADGVPLFIEEITRTVLEGAAIETVAGRTAAGGALPSIAVPSTLQASLLARLDRLSAIKEIAQVGAAIGREFSHALLSAVSGWSETDLEKALRQLIEADLIFVRGGGAEPGYVFKHALIQDVAYGALLRRPRQDLHARIAHSLTVGFRDQIEARPELLAHHLGEAGQAREAVDAWRLAAIKTLRGGSWKEGLRHLDQGLRAALSLEKAVERDQLELGLQMMVGGVTQGAVGHSAPGAIDAYRRAYDLARGLEDRRAAALAGSRLWIGQYGAGDLEGALRTVETTLEALSPIADPVDIALVKSCAATPLSFMGRFAEAQIIATETYATLENAGPGLAPPEYYFMSPFTNPLCAGMTAMLPLGRLQSWARLCRKVSGELHNGASMGGVIGLTMLIYTRYLAGDWAGLGTDAARLAQAVSEIEGADYYLELVALAQARLASRAGAPAPVAVIDEILQRPSVSFAMQHLPRYLLIAGDIFADAGNHERAISCFEEALKGGPCGSQQWLRSELQRRIGDQAMHTDQAWAERMYRQAMETARQQGALLFELRAALSLVRMSGERLDQGEAIEMLRGLCDRFEEPCTELAEATALLSELRRVSA